MKALVFIKKKKKNSILNWAITKVRRVSQKQNNLDINELLLNFCKLLKQRRTNKLNNDNNAEPIR